MSLYEGARKTTTSPSFSKNRCLPSKATSTRANLLGEFRAQPRTFERARRSLHQKPHGPRSLAQPNFPCPCIEVQHDFFLNFSLGIAWGDYLHTNFGSMWETTAITQIAHAVGRCPGHIGSFHSICGGNGALSEHSAVWHQLGEQSSDSSLPRSVSGCRRWAHNNLPMAICFNAAFEFSEFSIPK